MSTVKVAINGFGRIGRLVYRQIYNMEGIDVVAVNDLTSPAVLAHLLKYDTAQGRFDQDVKASDNAITVNGEEIKIYAEKDPANIPWGSHGVDVVLECTGFFTDKAKAEGHIKAGAKRTGLSISSYVRLALLNVLTGKREKLLDQAIADVSANRLESLTLKEFNRQLGDKE